MWQKKPSRIAIVIVVLLAVALPSVAQTQTNLEIGPRIGLDLNNGSRLLAGVEARIHVPNQPLAISPTLGYHFVDDVSSGGFGVSFSGDATLIQGGINGLYYLKDDLFEEEDLNLYAGAGLAVTRFSATIEASGFGSSFSADATDTMLGLNLLTGVVFPLESSVKPFAQGRLTLGQSAELNFEESVGTIETEGGDFLTATVGLLFSL